MLTPIKRTSPDNRTTHRSERTSAGHCTAALRLHLRL